MSTLTLPTELTIFTVDEWHPLCLSWLGDVMAQPTTALRIDAAAVDEVDSAGLQLLVSLMRTLDDRGLPAQLTSAPSSLATAARLTGLAGPLGLAPAAA